MGKGGRQRKKVNYNDDLSDEQFMKMIEEEYELNHPTGKEKKSGVQTVTDG